MKHMDPNDEYRNGWHTLHGPVPFTSTYTLYSLVTSVSPLENFVHMYILIYIWVHPTQITRELCFLQYFAFQLKTFLWKR